MSYISGNLGDDSRILVYDTVTNTLVVDEVVTAGSFQFDDLSSSAKHIVAINESTGESISYGNVTPAGEPFLFTDYFVGTSLNAAKWNNYVDAPAHITVDEELRLHYDGTAHGGSHVYSVMTLDRFGSYKMWAKWKAGINNYGNKSYQYPYVGFHSPNSSRGTYGEPTTNSLLVRLGVSGNTNTRTGVTITQNDSTLQTYGISIDMQLYHDIILEYNSNANTLTFTLNDSVIFNRSVGSNSAWTGLKFALGHTDYSTASVEIFDNVKFDQLA